MEGRKEERKDNNKNSYQTLILQNKEDGRKDNNKNSYQTLILQNILKKMY